jgi:putative flippase GtrA
VGAVNTLATGAIFLALSYALPAAIAYTIAFSIGILFSVSVTPRLVFREGAVPTRRVAYAAWYVVVYFVGLGLVFELRDLLGLDRVVVVGVTAGTTAILSYLGARRLFAPVGAPGRVHERRNRFGLPTLRLVSGASQAAEGAALTRVSNRAWGRHDLLILLILVLVAAVLPLITSAYAGSLEIARLDDWSYRRIAEDLADTGRVEMDGAAETMLLGQIMLTQPLLWLSGGQPWAFTAAGFGFATAAVVGAYAMTRQVLPPGRAAIAALMLPLFPGYLAYATSYMNDVPAMATQFLAVAFGAVAVSRRPTAIGWLILALGVGCLAFSTRHFALAAPGAVLLAIIATEPRRIRTWVLVIGTIAACLAIQGFRSSLPGQLGEVERDLLHVLRLPQALVTIALVLLPAVVVSIAVSGRYWLRRDVLAGVTVGAAVVAIELAKWVRWGSFPHALMDGLVTARGVPGSSFMFGLRPDVFERPVWAAINLLALASVVVAGGAIAGAAGMRVRGNAASIGRILRPIGSPAGVIGAFTLLAAGGMAAFGFFWISFDRYFWPIVPPLAALLMMDPPATTSVTTNRALGTTSARTLTFAHGALLGVVALVFMANSHAFDSARWRAGELLVSAGVPADQIDAGYEWMGFHSTEQATPADRVPAAIWYRGWWRDFQMCGLASSSDIHPPNGVVVGKVPYRLNLVAGPIAELWLYTFDDPACIDAASSP